MNHKRVNRFYAASLLALTLAMWLLLGVYGYHAGLALRPPVIAMAGE